MDLTGHKALITGAGQGIGRACAELLASRGVDLFLVDKNAQTLALVVERVTGRGGGQCRQYFEE